MFALLGAFLFLDGFDFGVEALFAFRDDEAERERFLAAIGPFWDGNEVWLVVFGGSLFAAFPPVYAALFSLAGQRGPPAVEVGRMSDRKGGEERAIATTAGRLRLSVPHT